MRVSLATFCFVIKTRKNNSSGDSFHCHTLIGTTLHCMNIMILNCRSQKKFKVVLSSKHHEPQKKKWKHSIKKHESTRLKFTNFVTGKSLISSKKVQLVFCSMEKYFEFTIWITQFNKFSLTLCITNWFLLHYI